MEILIKSDDEQLMQNMQAELREVIATQGLQDALKTGIVTPQVPAEKHRGDPMTVFTVLVAAVSAGGALTVALGRDGFLTQLARVFGKYIETGKVRIAVKDSSRELEIEGSARRIEKVLGEVLEHIKHQQD